MKTRPRIRSILPAAVALAALSLSLSRADPGDAKTSPEAAAGPPLGVTLNLSYDSEYMLYGYRLGRNLFHTDVSLWRPLTDRLSFWAGSWYGVLPDGTYHEVDVYGGVDWALTERLSVGVGYTLFNYIEVPFPTSTHVSEFAAQLAYAAGPLTLTVRDQYDTEAEGHLVRGIANVAREIFGRLSVDASAEFGYAFEYFIEGNRPNHALFTMKLPVRITDRIRATPFIARSLALAAIDGYEDDVTYGGLSVGLDL